MLPQFATLFQVQLLEGRAGTDPHPKRYPKCCL